MVYDIPTLDVAEPEKLAMLREKTDFEVASVGNAASVEEEIAAIESFTRNICMTEFRLTASW